MAKLKLNLKKICRGMYLDHQNDVGINHELVWSKAQGRKWIAHYHTCMHLVGGKNRREESFDTLKEARDFLKGVLARHS